MTVEIEGHNTNNPAPKKIGLFAKLENEGAARDKIFAALYQRNSGILAKGLNASSILILGCGSVGSYMSDKLVRSGVGRVILVDPDQVELHNLTRSAYRAADTGKSKVSALENILKAINPYVRIDCDAARLEDIPKDRLKAHIADCDLIICAADDKLTQAKVNRIAMHHKKPLINVGLYAGAEGGEVAVILPDLTPCLECTLAGRQFNVSRSDNLERETDYGTGRFKPTIGLGCDIHFVTNAAAKLALSLLTAMTDEDGNANAGKLVSGAVARGENLMIFGMTPNFWFLPQALANAKGQYAFQSVWLKASKREGCPCCGPHPDTQDPIDAIQSTPDLSGMRGAENGTA